MEITMEEIEEMKRDIEEEQKKLNERRRKVLELEKKYLRSTKTNEVGVYQMSPADLEKAKDISIREVHLVVNFNTRFIHSAGYAGIENLNQLYEWLVIGKQYSVTSVGEKIKEEAKRNFLRYMPNIIESVYKRRNNIVKNDTLLKKLTDQEKFLKILDSRYNIRTLKELYDEDVKNFYGIFQYSSQGKLEKKVTEILCRF